MNVGQLMNYLQDIDSDIEVLVPGPDHSYCVVRSVESVLVEKLGYNEYYEYDGEVVEPLKAVVIT